MIDNDRINRLEKLVCGIADEVRAIKYELIGDSSIDPDLSRLIYDIEKEASERRKDK